VSAPSPLGLGLYFIDVLACLLFCLTLALVGARFGREASVPLDLPRLPRSAAAGSEISGAAIVVRSADGGLEFFYEDERVSFQELEARLTAAPPPSVLVRSETSAVARVIGAAHAAGVRDIRLAYQMARGEEGR
jgi:biopolymer transport protein ExbD